MENNIAMLQFYHWGGGGLSYMAYTVVLSQEKCGLNLSVGRHHVKRVVTVSNNIPKNI